MKKKVLVFTGSRADYGILKNLIIKLKKNFSVEICAGGSHFSSRFGYTYKEIIKDKNSIKYKSLKGPMGFDNYSLLKFMSKSLLEYSKFVKISKSDLVIILGDRYEAFIFAIASFFLQKKIIHIHGGEVTSGAFDDSLRHSISKLSNYHFVSHTDYLKRLIQLGEDKKRIYITGALGVENFSNAHKLNKQEIIKKFNLNKNYKIALITFHPETRSSISIKKQIIIFLNSLKKINNINFVFTYNNADTGANYFIKKIKEFSKKKNKNFRLIKSLGSDMYFSILKSSDIIIGNSSSGILEAPSARTPTLNIGNRQLGRVFGPSVFQCSLEKKHITKNISKILKLKKIRFKNPYYKKNVSSKMISLCKKIVLKKKEVFKKFYDVK